MSVAEETVLRCPALRRKDGQPCTGKQTSSGYCVAHDPRANEWRARGGKATSSANRAARLLPSRLQPMVQLLEAVFADLYKSTGHGRTARDATALASVALAIGRLFQIGESEQRLRDLEASVEQWQRSDRGRWSA
jgi:hypothetical protein